MRSRSLSRFKCSASPRWGDDRAEALEVIRRSAADYRETFGAPESRLDELRRLLAKG